MHYKDQKSRNEALFSELRFEEIKKMALLHPTPCLYLDLARIDRAYTELTDALPGDVFFAMKACSHDDVIRLLASRGSFFDVASVAEIAQLLRLGIPGEKMSFGNTAKKEVDIAYARAHGITIFASDDKSDLDKIARQAPGSRVCIRLLHESRSAKWELSDKFGAHSDDVFSLAVHARDIGLVPYAISFHVGSQQCVASEWNDALGQVRSLFERLADEQAIHLECINIGGGLPANYTDPTDSVAEYGKKISGYLADHFDLTKIRIISEPGRSLVGDAGVIASEVVMVSRKGEGKQVTIDIGRYSGIYEAGAFEYPLFFPNREHQTIDDFGFASLVGPSCDSTDKFGKTFMVPDDLVAGEIIFLGTTGAYTYQCSSVGFNGFSPMETRILDLPK